ncbi:hypothetical protein K435DRAFT_765673 [Dendrothele bispora CBS 962.96]|uniref:Uncharacterized protein n=1 Tax=Dendrothele bispora (strain CBS 962.96) TaxID=1314807 RepID=A0A4S8L6G7_DENBC|nr:hypothetical protein K435DRAFT_765673 [Dendrothele bispora CBS 962.96]
MAVPADFNVFKIRGKFAINRSLSGPMDTMFRLQNLSWVTRKALGLVSVTAHITYTPPADSSDSSNGAGRIDVVPYISGGFKWSVDSRPLDFSSQEVSNPILGKMVYRSRKVRLSEVKEEDEWLADGKCGLLKEGWEDGSESDEFVHSNVKGKGWVQDEVWGTMNIDGEKRFVMRYRIVNDAGEAVDLKLVYDYSKSICLRDLFIFLFLFRSSFFSSD